MAVTLTGVKNCFVKVANGQKEYVILSGVVYKVTDMDKLVELFVTQSGGVWSAKTAAEYIARLKRVDYYGAITMLTDAGNTLTDAVSAFESATAL